MTTSYQSFIDHTGSTLTKKNTLLNKCFDTYQFSSECGKGYTAVYELDSYASICIAEHSYTRDFEYAVPVEDSIVIQQYDSIDPDRRDHSNIGEDRFIMLGLSSEIHILLVCHYYEENDRIRIISARKANLQEAKQYGGN